MRKREAKGEGQKYGVIWTPHQGMQANWRYTMMTFINRGVKLRIKIEKLREAKAEARKRVLC